MNLFDQLAGLRVIPVVKIDDAKNAVPLAEALKNGGLRCAEITFRTDAAEESIRLIHKAFPDFLLIAGTVLTTEKADCAIRAGAVGIVAPGFNPTVVRHCIEKGYPVLPGVCTPSEIEAAMELGLTHLKFFPAEAAGGVGYIKAISAPYSMVKFMPTGGINLGNVKDYLANKAVFCCGGSWMVPGDRIAAGDFAAIEKLTRDAVELTKEI